MGTLSQIPTRKTNTMTTTTENTLSDWDKAHILGKRTFYERSTQTIRACPENYCLAHKGDNGWKRYGNDNATRGWWTAIDRTIEIWKGGSTGEALATAIGKAIEGVSRQ